MEKSILSFIKNVSNMIYSMKLLLAISIAIGLALVLAAVINAGPLTQQTYAAVSSSAGSGGSGVTTRAGSLLGVLTVTYSVTVRE